LFCTSFFLRRTGGTTLFAPDAWALVAVGHAASD